MSILSFTNSKPEQKILTFLKEVDASFQPKLSTKVDLVTYSKKLSKLANVFFATLDNKDIGIVAFYINSDRRTAFITVIGVLPDCQGKGIGKFLLDLVQDYAIEKDLSCLELEVDKVNTSAIRFYQKNGFVVSISDHLPSIDSNVTNNDSFYMNKRLPISKMG
jgi:ribosomal protein S18 acetylase RimI-like enzyme